MSISDDTSTDISKNKYDVENDQDYDNMTQTPLVCHH